MKGNRYPRTLGLTVLLAMSVGNAPVQAEDIEVFFTKQSNNVAPNVLFVLDSSGSMNEESGGTSRIDVLKNSLHEVLKPSEPYKALNVGIMDFGGDRSGGIDFPVTDINGDAHFVDNDIPEGTDVGTVLDYIAKSYTARGQTPMGDALYFSSSYYAGLSVFNSGNWRGGRNLPQPTWNTETNSYTGGDREADNPASYTGKIDFSDTTELRERVCSTSDRRPIRRCGANPQNCRTETWLIPARPARYSIYTYSCDSSGLECSWSSTRWRDGTPPNCGSWPSHPQDGDTWVRCVEERPESSYEYQRCTETYTHIVSRQWTPPATYNSPITHRCQRNYVVMLTDGVPTRRSTLYSIASRVSPVTGSNSYHDCDDLSRFNDEDIRTNGRCLPELVEYMARYDQSPDLPDKQSVYTYTIGFKLSGNDDAQDFLKLLAEKSKGTPSDNGEGEYFDANSPEQLVAIFKKIIKYVTQSDVSFVSPSVNIDPSNPLATSEYLYRPEFTPSDKPRWSGDIIKTRIDPNSPTGFVDDTSNTLASSLVARDRVIVTLTGQNPELRATDNLFVTTNDRLKALLAPTTAIDLDDLIQWTRGIDVQDENDDGDITDERKHMGDSLHSVPILVNYNNAQRQVLYVTTNDGMLHAFDVSGAVPREIFAFIPPELLPNLDTLYRNSNNDTKVYGLDGKIAIWQNDSHTYLYVGMRRGGSNYYALDVTDPERPRWLWTIKGGAGDFAELGQTWSTPQLSNVMVGDRKTMALIFGGGYDTDQDNEEKTATRTADDIGRAIFIVDAETGEKIWSAGPDSSHDLTLDGMSNSIPSDVRIIDLDGNGLVDRLYVGDMGGRVWRIDLDQDGIRNSSGYLLADFNDGTADGNRRFYYPPSVAFDRQSRLMVAIGSGYRAHPTEMVTKDRFYVFQDPDAVIGAPRPQPKPVIETDLGDITDELALTANKPGWYIRLEPGEKVLAESIIFNSKVVFTSYQPNFQQNNETCNLSGNTPRVRILALADGRPVLGDGGADSEFTVNNRLKVLESVQFIPGAPYITFNKPDTGGQANAPLIGGDRQQADLFVGKELIDTDSFLTERISWQNR